MYLMRLNMHIVDKFYMCLYWNFLTHFVLPLETYINDEEPKTS